ncbi:MAG: NADH-quinone oxidoreductase subunit N [Parachlamydiaceae bacterium]
MNTSLNLTDILALSPFLILLFGALSLILLESFLPNVAKKSAGPFTLIVLLFALMAAFYSPVSSNLLLTNWIYFDSLSRFFAGLFLMVGVGCTLLSIPFFKRFEASRGEYNFLLVAALFGLLLISSSADFLTLFLGLETLSMSLYILCAYVKQWKYARESATKYFLMGALATAFLLYGIALVYGATGTTNFAELFKGFQASATLPQKGLFYGGIALITLGLAFKAAIVPAHTWAPDVYDGAPTPVAAFMAVATKIGAFTALIRIFLQTLPDFSPAWSQSIALLAIPTLIYANIVALQQVQLRRFFAYSGIAHAGLLLIPLAVGGNEATQALLFYFVVYSLATLGCFAILAYVDQREEGVLLSDLQGLYHRSPLLALLFTVSLLTLAGIPPSAGFFSKFFVFKIAFQAGYKGFVIIALLMTILSAFYYLRIVALLFSKEPHEAKVPAHSIPIMTVAAFCLAGLLALSFYPEPLLNIFLKISLESN